MKVERVMVDVLGTTSALASPLDDVMERGMALAVCIYRGVRNCLQSTLQKD